MQRVNEDFINIGYRAPCLDRDTCLEDLRRSYITQGHPISFSALNNIRRYYYPFLSVEDIENVLSEIESFTLHKEFHKHPRNPSYSHYPRYQFQMDLLDVQALAPFNNDVRYLLVCIDTYTRYAFVRPLHSKEKGVVLDAFKSILQEARTKPRMVVVDRGTEFQNDLFVKYLHDNGIRLFMPDTSIHAAYIERFNRTFQQILYKYMTENETRRYISRTNPTTGQEELLLPLFIESYNNRYHRMIGTTPHTAETLPESHIGISNRMSKYYESIKPEKVRFSVGDTVRIQRIKGKFRRGYNERARQEIFKIHRIKTNMKRPLIELTDYSGNELIKGRFYQSELVKVGGNIFRVEKVLKKRKLRGREQLFVKWKGFNDTYNSWIDADQVSQVFNR